MAKTNFLVSERNKVSKEQAEKTATTNDSKRVNFDLSAETGEELTLTGDFYEATWERYEGEGENRTKKGEGVILFADAKRADGKTKIQIPFGLFRSANKLASGGSVIECKAHFTKNATNKEILDFCLTKAKVKVERYTFFREGMSNESEITKVI